LLSQASLRKLEAAARQIATSTAAVECGHAAVRRRVRCRVQTHASKLSLASAVRAVSRVRTAALSSWPVRAGLQPAPGQAVPPVRAAAADENEAVGLRRPCRQPHGDEALPRPAKRRRVGAGGAWRAFGHQTRSGTAGRTSFAEQGVLYRGLSADEMASFRRAGQLATAAHRAGIRLPFGVSRRVATPLDARTRLALHRRKRAFRLAGGVAWDRAAQVQAVRQEVADKGRLLDRAGAAARAAALRGRQLAADQVSALRRFAEAEAHPALVNVAGMTREPGLAEACWHMPQRLEAVQTAVESIGAGLNGVAVSWEARHNTVSAGDAEVLGPQRAAPACRTHGRCVCV
jgi:hypothetical protein